jgi:hypothetical protein
VSDVHTSLARVRQRVASAATRAGRDPASVRLVAVSKMHGPEAVRAAYEAGQRAFGENYAQELRDKAQELADLPGIRWHAIGPLQTNKAKYVARTAHAFHALDRLEIARELSKRRTGAPLACYVEVHLGEEATKSGVEPEEVPALVEQVRGLAGLELVGLMAMPPFDEPPEQSRAHFRLLRELARRVGLKGLSMGSTYDFEIAIEEGSTAVRIGTAIFGERPTSP